MDKNAMKLLGKTPEDMKKSHERLRERQRADKITGILFEAGKKVLDRGESMTPFEEGVFSKYEYYNWDRGAHVGMITFGVLLGALQLRTGRILAASRLPTKQAVEAARSMRPHKAEDITPTIFQGIERNVVVAASISSVLALITAGFSMDNALMLRNIASVPLQPGSSAICNAACPALMKFADTEQDKVVTTELESMQLLVRNCKKRLDYQRSMSVEDPFSVEIPAGGIPDSS